MEIRIERPIDLHLEVFETDDHVPSMHMNAKVVVSQFQHTCRYDGEFWVECASWDAFTNSLRALSWQEAILRDMNGCFTFALRRTDETLLLVWEFAKSDICSDRKMNSTFSSQIDDDMFGKIKSEFLDFPVWW